MGIKRKRTSGPSRRRPRKYDGKKKRKTTFSRRVERIARTVVMKKSESKHKAGIHGLTQMNHDTIYWKHLNTSAMLPDQGVGDNQRIGDQINLSGYKLRLVMGQKADRPNVTFKFWVISVPKGTGYSYGSWFDAVTNNTLLDSTNSDLVKVHKVGVWKPYKGYMNNASDEFTFVKQMWIPRRKLIKFTSNGGIATNDNDVFFMLTAYDAQGTLVTDNIAYFTMYQATYYRDP